ncbi:hypothetical protein GCM10009555_028630 [Acrocarpospora macrocephala]|uniref:Uncharacterized protein n=1 Tax=Acrocarpospora macrocephala TaxID=150177 RepID=A0A5M3XCQ8_9ACTN|nr:hypothetical protein Amac_094360 [Acrocarpospora macrocephala]
MTESPAQERFRKDSFNLAEIGRHLREQLSPVEVRLPVTLIETARAAWAREELDPHSAETFEQTLMRSLAGQLALIGLVASQDLDRDGDEYLIRLKWGQIASALFAADLWDDHEPGNR